MTSKKYRSFWLAFVNITAKKGLILSDLIDLEGLPDNENYRGAWANIIVKAETISKAIEIIPLGLCELNFKIIFIDKVENIGSLINHNEINENVKKEVDWLLKSEYVFMISDKLFPYE